MYSACLFVSNKRQNGWTDRDQIFCESLHDPGEGLWMIRISKIRLQQNSIFIKEREVPWKPCTEEITKPRVKWINIILLISPTETGFYIYK